MHWACNMQANSTLVKSIIVEISDGRRMNSCTVSTQLEAACNDVNLYITLKLLQLHFLVSRSRLLPQLFAEQLIFSLVITLLIF